MKVMLIMTIIYIYNIIILSQLYFFQITADKHWEWYW